MNRTEFKEFAAKGPIMFDGSTGMELSKRGMPSDVCNELWMLDNHDTVFDMQREYVKAGSQILLTPTFVASSIKLDKYGLKAETVRINKELSQITRMAAGNQALVAADIGPTGEMIAPMGMTTFDEIYDVYREQVLAILPTNPDMFLLETFMDLNEIRAALLAIRSVSDIPVIASMTFEGGSTLMGTSPKSAAIALVAAGADAVGCNCSAGPHDLAQVLNEMSQVVDVPLFAKPNAGIPQMIDGKTVFPLEPCEFAQECKVLLDAGASFIGGCCGAGPEHVQELADVAVQYKSKPADKQGLYICGPRKAVKLSADMPLTIIGERINPTGKQNLADDFAAGGYFTALDMSTEQLMAGARIIDVNVSVPGIDQSAMMYSVIENLCSMSPSPMSIDSPDDDVIERGLFRFPGRAILNSISGESSKCEARFALAKKYGAVPIILPMDDDGIPKTAAKRMEILNNILEIAGKYGFSKHDVIVDALVLPISVLDHVMEAVEFVSMCEKLDIITVAGLSNVSFGLPARSRLNSSYLSMLAGAGLCLVIADPNDKNIIKEVDAINALRGNDVSCMNYIKKYR